MPKITKEFLVGLGVQEDVAAQIVGAHDSDLEEARKTAVPPDPPPDPPKKGPPAPVEKNVRPSEAAPSADGDLAAQLRDALSRLGRLEQENAAQKAQIEARDYEDAVRAGVKAAGVRFSSKAAERDLFSAVREKKFPLKDGKLEGLDAYIEALRKAEPDAFAQEGTDAPLPRLVSVTTSGAPTAPRSSQARAIVDRMLAEQYGVRPEGASAGTGKE